MRPNHVVLWLGGFVGILSACTNDHSPSSSVMPTGHAGAVGETQGPPTTESSLLGLDPEIVSIVAQVSAAHLSDHVNTLVAFGTRNSCSDNRGGPAHTQGIGAARDWIKQLLSAIPGLHVTLDNFTMPGCANGSQTDQNVLAWLPGSGHPDRLIVIGGHYDSRTIGRNDGTSPAPGANDSGSQTALVLEAARLLANHSFDATLVFVAFAGEEQGLIGSKSLATGYKKYFTPSATVEAVLNCDIVGGDNSVNSPTTLQQFRLFSPGTPREIVTPIGTTDDTSPSRGLMRFIGSSAQAYVPTMAMLPQLREDRPSRGGDHESFIDQAYPGVRFIETIESPNAGTTASHQHSPNDLASFITPDYHARVTQVVVATAANLARAPGAPQALVAAGSAATSVTVHWSAPATGAAVDHYVIAARDVGENFYRTRVAVPAAAGSHAVSPADLGLSGSAAFFISVAAVDAHGHESLFAYPEYRCDRTSCLVPPAALNVTVRD
jgi:hypothetical protein